MLSLALMFWPPSTRLAIRWSRTVAFREFPFVYNREFVRGPVPCASSCWVVSFLNRFAGLAKVMKASLSISLLLHSQEP